MCVHVSVSPLSRIFPLSPVNFPNPKKHFFSSSRLVADSEELGSLGFFNRYFERKEKKLLTLSCLLSQKKKQVMNEMMQS